VPDESAIKDAPSPEEKEVEGEGDYNMLNESSSFCGNVQALLVKRKNIYKRDKAGICCEVLVPAVMVLMGCALAQI